MKSFVDFAKIKIKAGDGGDGMVFFRREKYVPRGGPSGGDGGKGGDVYLLADKNLATLYDFTHRRSFTAENGEKGKPKNMTGRSGQDLYLRVPIGTTVKVQDEIVADLMKHGQKVLVVQGGRGGWGNTHFKSATNQAPRQATSGEPGEEKELVLELKLIADVGIIGLPNAGKSTLLNALTAAQARVGEYPFTTLHPNLGVMKVRTRQIVLADIPGLIEGASLGRGLGDEFLRHIERTRVLVHLIDPLSGLDGKFAKISNLDRQALTNYQVVQKELANYSKKLLEKPEVVVINKVDVTEVSESLPKIKSLFKKEIKDENLPVLLLAISAATGTELESLKKQVMILLGS